MAYLNIPTKSTGGTLSASEFNQTVQAVQGQQRMTGFGVYFDTQYTEAAPQVITSAQGWVNISNNAGNVNETYLPTQFVGSLYSGVTNKIQPQTIGATLNGYIRFDASTNNQEGYLLFGVDIDGDQGIIFQNTYRFPRGQNVNHPFTIPFNFYCLENFVANGGIPKVQASPGTTIEIWNCQIFVNRISVPI